MKLRSYQQSAVNRALARTERSLLLVSPTGSGKTTIAAAIAQAASLDGERVLACAHRDELVDQLHGTLSGLLGGDHVGMVAAGRLGGESDVTVASLPTLMARAQRPQADLVILDEAHHAAASTFAALLASYPQSRIIGLTATPQRGDGRGLGMFDALHVVTTPRELEAAGWLVPMEIIRPARQLRPGQIAQRPVDAWLAHAHGRPTIVFCSSVAHAEQTAAEFRATGAAAWAIDAKTDDKMRRGCMLAFRDGELQILCNVAILTEGTDLPRASCAILARGCGTQGLFMQMAGRIARPHAESGKRDALLIDLRGVSHTHDHPYADREYTLDGRGIRKRTDPEVDPGRWCRVCGAAVEPATACAECGIEAAAAKPIKVTNSPLVKYAAARRAGADKRAENLRLWRQIQRARGYKRHYAEGRYKAVYGTWPPTEVQALARE